MLVYWVLWSYFEYFYKILKSKDYKIVSKEVYKAIVQNQDSEIHIMISGPVGLNFMLGQLVGLSHFDVILYQYDNIKKGYKRLPSPNRSWLKY